MSQHRLRIVHIIFIFIFLVLPKFLAEKKSPKNPLPQLLKPLIAMKSAVSSYSKPQIEPYSNQEIVAFVNEKRLQIDLNPLTSNKELCNTSQHLMDMATSGVELSETDLKDFCPDCTQTAYIFTASNQKNSSRNVWKDSPDINSYILGDYQNICVLTDAYNALLLFSSQKTTKKDLESTQANTQAIAPKNFTREELWQALVDYRHAHTKPDLQFSQSLCTYAQKRVDQHLMMFENTDRQEYPNLDKYPLDAHAGFREDADSGYVFKVTGFNVVAENLAYWPAAQYPHQVIEWGWDTSTEGHKETQLSDEYSHACLAEKDGFYVAIFARN